jgi:hypothetical protein
MAKAKRSTTSPPKPARKKVPDALTRDEARTALDRATRNLKALCKAQYANAWKIGRALLQVSELNLHHARGFSTLDDYAAKHLDLSRDTTFQYMRVADAFSESVVGAFGPERLDRGLRYIAATPEDESARDLPTLKIRTRTADGAVREKDFAAASIDEIRAATTAERGETPPKRARAKAPAMTPATLEALNAALDAAVGRAAARGTEVRLRRDAKGREVLDLRGVPLPKAPAALRAVAKALG